MSPLRILIVDDSDVTRHILGSIVRSREWIVCGEAENGRSAIEKFKALMPDVVLLDLAMPVMNGIEAARTMSTIDPTVPIILFTGLNLDEPTLERAARKAGVSAIVPKGECWMLLKSIEFAAANCCHARIQ